MNGPVLSIVILAIATVLISGVMIYYRIPQVYAQEEDTGVQTIYFSQTRGVAQENGFPVAGTVNCPDGTVEEGVIFDFLAFKAPHSSVNGTWTAGRFLFPELDLGTLTYLSLNGDTFEVRGNLTTRHHQDTRTDQTAIMCKGTPINNNTSVTITGECGVTGDINFVAGNGITGKFSGKTTCNNGDTIKQATLTVTSQELGLHEGTIHSTGMWITIRNEAGMLLASGFTPLKFIGNTSTIYNVTASEYAGIKFVIWGDDHPRWGGLGPRGDSRLVIPSSDTTINAIYQPEFSLVKGFTALSNPEDLVSTSLTVKAASLENNQTLSMWTIIRKPPNEQPSESNQRSFTVYMHDYRNYIFDHWSDNGSTDRIRTLIIGESKTITAYYRTG